jgi:hypothetical protein
MDPHISVVADFKSANPEVEVVDWCLSGHAWVMNRSQDTPKHIHAGNWNQLDEAMIVAFQKEYDFFLQQFDGFLTGHAMCFAMIYEKYNKPIIAINTCRYDMPFCWSKSTRVLQKYIESLRRMYSRGQLQIVSNNRADQDYTYFGTGIRADYNPSLCLYTNTQYAPTKPTFVYYTGVSYHPLISSRPAKHEWSDITSYRGVIHVPYDASLMSMFEHFTAGCPLFVPSKQFWKTSSNMKSVSNYWGENLPDYLSSVAKPEFWIERSDLYTLFASPNTYYFDSFQHLTELLEAFEYVDDRAFRAEHIAKVKAKWTECINNAMTWKYSTQYPAHLCYNRLPLLANVVYDCDYTSTGVKAQHTYPFHSQLRRGDVVFVKTDLLSHFLSSVAIPVPITLVTGVSDMSPSPADCEKILQTDTILRWIGCNIPVSHPKIQKVLIGVGEPERPNGNHETLRRLHDGRQPWETKKDELCIPYHGDTHETRTETSTLPKLPFEEYMREIGKFKFVRCMRGNGLDTHRFCEILLMGSVPVVDHSPLDDLYNQFPCVFVDEDRSTFVWDDQKYDEFLGMFWLVRRNE